MKNNVRSKLVSVAKKHQTTDDPSHDFQHVLRVLNIAEEIGKEESADLDVVTPAALFHDIIVYPKNSKRSKNETEESAQFAEDVLSKTNGFNSEKIESVKMAIRECSFSKGLQPSSIESAILQDADRLEATGAIAIMRTFSSGGQMNQQFYAPEDPFAKKGAIAFRSGVDLFYNRLLIVEKTMHTNTAKEIAKRRTKFLKTFLEELSKELIEAKILK